MRRGAALAGALLLAGCASPVVTRIDSRVPAPLPRMASFALVPVPDEDGPISGQARDMVAAALTQRGWSQAESGTYLLAVAVADRPAVIALQSGDDFGKPVATLAAAADRSNNRGCAKSDHRLMITLTERVSGAVAFAGSASEFHCKAALDDTLPHLVAAAVERLDIGSGNAQLVRKGAR